MTCKGNITFNKIVTNAIRKAKVTYFRQTSIRLLYIKVTYSKTPKNLNSEFQPSGKLKILKILLGM